MNSPKTALISGANGQDGHYLARHLLGLGYRVLAGVRGLDRGVADGAEKVLLASIVDAADLCAREGVGEFYHLAGDSFAGAPMHGASAMIASNSLQVAEMLEKFVTLSPQTRIFLAGSAAVFGNPPHAPQNEDTLRAPTTLYGGTKLVVHHLADLYRERGLHVCVGILFNHESPLRGKNFVTRKITLAAAKIAAGLQENLILGNLEAQRDWGHAEDFVRAMHLLLQGETPRDRVIATGKTHSIREFCEMAFAQLGLDASRYVVSSPKFWRPAEPIPQCGDASRLRAETGWEPTYSFQEIVAEMIQFDQQSLLSSLSL